jgi:MFS family permease
MRPDGTTESLVTAKIRWSRLATMAGFGALGGMAYAWSTSVTNFREQLGLTGAAGDLEFGAIALTGGIAAAIGSLAVGMFADRFGPRRPITLCAILYPVTLIALGHVNSFAFAVALGAVLGLFRGAMDTALNTHGIQVERYYGRSIMSSFHFCYSFGGFLIGLVGSWMCDRYTTNATVQFSVLGAVLLLLAGTASRWMLRKDEILPAPVEKEVSGTDSSPTGVHSYTRASVIFMMIAFGVLLLGSMVGENVVGDWGQEYLHRIVHSGVSLAGVAVSVFIGGEAVGRIFGDRLAQHFGRPTVVFVSGVLAVSGLALAVIVNGPIASLIGFAALGLGLSSIAPLMFSSAGRTDPVNAGRNIGIVNSIGFSANLVSPAVITLVVTHFGLERLLFFPIVMLLPLASVGPLLMRRAELRTRAIPKNDSVAGPARNLTGAL